MEVKALFDKFQNNKKVIKAKQRESKANVQEEPSKPQKTGQNPQKTQKLSKKSKFQNQGQEASGRPNKRTEEGFQVYTEEQLRLGNGKVGETPDCPFDCECCY